MLVVSLMPAAAVSVTGVVPVVATSDLAATVVSQVATAVLTVLTGRAPASTGSLVTRYAYRQPLCAVAPVRISPPVR